MHFYNKKGVSLVAVLLFMLIATIAGTATYKWLSSEGRSSADRMRLREAEYAADAGIASARNWMTYHGNETGALIRQYLKDSRKTPISMDDLLNPLTKENQEFKVWFVGADIESNPYTVKILAEGKAAGGTSYRKVSIMNVNGLYRAKVPKIPRLGNFEESIFAGSTGGISLDVSSGIINGDAEFNTKVDVEKRLIVAGNLNVNSSTKVKDLFVNGNLYTCTNFEVSNNTFVKGKIYLNGLHTYGGDVYAENGIDMSGEGAPGVAQCNTGAGVGITVEGNLTSNGDVITPRHNAGTKYTVKGNLVVNRGGVLNFPNVNSYSSVMGTQPYEAKFLGNVYLSGGINNDGFHLRYNSAPNFVLGSAGKYVYSGTKLYRVSDSYGMVSATTDYNSYWGGNDVSTLTPNTITYKTKSGTTITGGEALASNTFCNKADCAPTDNNGANFWKNSTFYNCSGTQSVNGENVGDNCVIARNDIFFQVNGNYVASIDTTGWGAQSMDDLKEMIVDHDEGNCKGPHVSDVLQFNENLLKHAKMHSSENKGACAGGEFEPQYNASFWDTGSKDRWALLDKCYDAAQKAGELLDDEWLLIKFPGSNYQFQNLGASTILRKKYVIIFEENGVFSLPPTSSDANVMMYWMKGGTIAMTNNAPFRNYFIYSLGDVDYNGGDGKGITGSIYLADCHKIKAVNTIVADYNATTTAELSEASILCAFDGTKKCTKTSSTGGSSGADKFTDEDYDPYIIAMAPQLLLTTKSEYKSDEKDIGATANSTTTVSPSIMVMPRILYLPRKPVGKLSDYYDIINLNGANETKTPSNVTCDPSGIPASERFASYADSLNKGVYTCTYSSNAYGDASFYVLVDGNIEDLKLNFEKDFYEVSATQSEVDVKFDIPAGSSNPQEMKIDVYMSPLPSGWSVFGQTPTITNSDGSAVYTLTLTPSAERRFEAVFHVVKSGDAPGSVYFQLIPPYSGCKPGALSVARVGTSGSVNVVRQEVSDYCGKYHANCQNDEGNGNKFYAVINSPSCDEFLTKDGVTDVWVYAKGTNCTANSSYPNNSWTCSMHSPITLKAQGMNALASKYCEVSIPPLDNQFDPTKDNETGYLYGSVVRKSKTLTVTLSPTVSSESGILLKMNSSSTADEPDPSAEVRECRGSGSVCQFVVYPNYKYFLYPIARGEDKFSYFKCTGKDCTEENAVNVGKYPLLISDDNSFYVAFNDKDSHCFYEDFTPTEGKEDFVSFCGNGNVRCIDTCSVSQASGNSCEVTKSAQAEMGNETPDWVMVYNNREANCSQWIKTDECEEYYTVFPLNGTCKRRKNYCSSSNKVVGSKQIAPQISNNYLHASNSSDVNASTANSVQAVVLSTKDAGFNGTMTSYFKTDANPIHNSGFIFRSNDDASEYYQLNIYGNASLLGSLAHVSNLFYAELCLVHGQGTRDHTNDICVEKQLATSSYSIGSDLIISENTSMTLILKIKGSKVDLNVGLDRVFLKDGERGISFDLASEFNGQTLADDRHNRVGLKLSNSSFRIYDISWMSETYSGTCYDAPRLLCSFKANYLGGNVPLNSEVTPWVAYSSFIDSDKKYEGCELQYFYNGCDLESGYTSFMWNDWSGWYQYFSCSTGNKDGSYWDQGSTMKDRYYNFTDEGPHGFAYTPVATSYNPTPFPGIKKDAKVKVVCPSGVTPPSSLLDTKTCGEFLVGELKFCSETYDFRKMATASMYCEANTNCDIPVTGAGLASGETSVNLRDGSVALEFINENNATIAVSLVDKSGRTSSARNTDGTSFTVLVNDIANTDLFDPQTITAIRVKGSESFYVTGAISGCPYALGITGCSVSYNGSSWNVRVSASNASSCDITPADGLEHLGSSAKKSDVVCSEEGSSYTFDDPDFFNKISTSGRYSFEVVAKDGEKTSTRICSSENIQPLTVSCDDLSETTVIPGMGVPSFGFQLGNCSQLSSGKCPYTVTLDGVAQNGSAENTSTATGSVPPFNAMNTPGNKYSVGETHTWAVSTAGGNVSCSKDFTVVSAEGDASAVCALNEAEKNFSAQVSPDNHPWSAYVNVYDAQGHDIAIEAGKVNQQAANQTTYFADLSQYTLSNGAIVTFVLNGNVQSNCTFTYGSSSPTSSSSSVANSSAAASSASTPISGATLCMVRNESGTGTNHPKIVNVPAGTYTFKHNCGVTKKWWLYCTSGMNITVGGKSYQCYGQKDTPGAGSIKGYDVDDILTSGSQLVVPEGMTIYSMSCDQVVPAPKDPAGCTKNGIVDGPVDPPPVGPAGTTTCNFANSSHSWGDGDNLKFKTTCTNCSYVVKSPSGEIKASGTTQGNKDQENQAYISNIAEIGNYSVFIDGKPAAACVADPKLPEMKTSYCTPEKTTLAPNASTKFKANMTQCNNNACNWYLKKNGTKINSGTYGNYIEPYITGPGTYTLHLLAEDADAACSVKVDGASPAENCKMDNSNRNYGEKSKFQVEHMSIGSGSSWELLDPNNSVIQSGTFSYSYNNSWFETGEFYAKVDGFYKLKVDGAEACSAELTVSQPSVSNCTLDNSTLSVGQSTNFKFNLNNCKNNQCSYEVKFGDEVVVSKENESDGNKSVSVTADETGTYKVWLNGTDASCSANMTVTGEFASPGSYNYCIDQYNSNQNIDGKFKNGSFTFDFCKSCAKIQIQASELKKTNSYYKLNGIVHDCNYLNYSFVQHRRSIELDVSSQCVITHIYVSDCK